MVNGGNRRTLAVCIALTVAVGFIGFTRWRVKREQSRRRKRKKEGSVNIGGIFGMDIGGTLSKIVYFERKAEKNGSGRNEKGCDLPSVEKPKMTRDKSFEKFDTPAHQKALEDIYIAMQSSKMMGETGKRDKSLSFYSSFLGGRFHFIHFETRMMETAIQHLSSTEITENIKSMGCTGGGAHKYGHIIHDSLGIEVVKFDELLCLIRGMHFVLMNFGAECYTYRYDDDAVELEQVWQRDQKDYVRKVQIPYNVLTAVNPFPYLVVSIGSGVSILKVTSPGKFERVSGTSIGGGTYWGLCRLFTRCTTFEDVLALAENGDNGEVDMLVRDIYGGGYDAMNLRGSMVASSFGKLVMKESPGEGLREEDLAIALLMMITNNIGQVAYLNAQLHNCTKIFFVGNFLRTNNISCRRLAFAISFWSKGTMEALFLEHEGYFGALGAFLESAFGDKVDDILVSTEDMKKNTRLKHEDGEALRFVSPKPTNTRLSTSAVDLEALSSTRTSALLSPDTMSSSSPRRGRTASLDSAGLGILGSYNPSSEPIAEH